MVLKIFYQTSFLLHFPKLSMLVSHQLPFLRLKVLLTHLLTVYLGATSLHVLFHLCTDPCKCRKYPSCWLCQYLLNQAWVAFFFDECPTHIINNTACLVCWFNVKIKCNFNGIWYNHVISWTMWYINVNVLTWVCYVWYVNLGNLLPFVFKSKLCSMFYHRI